MTEITTLSLIQRSLARKIQANDEIIAKFSADILKDAEYAMRWADSAMEAAAFNRVAKELLTGLEEPGNQVTIESARDYFTKALESAIRRVTSQSTSQCTNSMNLYRMAALAKIIELLKE